MPTNDPIWGILREQGRSLAWLARVTGYRPGTVTFYKTGRRRISPKFRAEASRALGLPESILFRLGKAA